MPWTSLTRILATLSFFIQVHNKYSCLFVGTIAAYLGEGSGPILGGIYCRGTEPNITECSSGGRVGQLNCHHGRDVGVICQGRCWAAWVLSKHLEQWIYQICINSNWSDCELWNVTPCRSCVLGDCGHRSSQWSTPHWIHCEPHLPHTPTTTWVGGDLSMERLCSKHISSCCKLQPALRHSHHWERPPSAQQNTTVRCTTGIKYLPTGSTVITVQGRLHLIYIKMTNLVLS